MLDVVLRIALAYLFLMVVFRLIGKRELSELTPFELVTLMLIPETLSNALARSASLTHGLTSASTLFLLVIATSVLAHRFRAVEKVVESEPTYLVRDGVLCVQELNRERITPEELFSEMHQNGYASLAQIQHALLESGGHIAFIPVRQATPPAPERQGQTPRTV